ncbi:RagB/SusD family nutrient uptake outer membrane protein [Butyricimonas faecalis]|uniref:RagB/SusD family nutrient uptake outer membrane protein n=1 Tax=Butyricimonas faecalis TaxID=2093856 RepID=A0A3Q9IT19_9BACT|nr:RagB/SusD family nutrient uptake outer membrane protein [Butyricimonas faecalis]AZS30218.1 RagB/SusD family nutrient uptake outer membrane protein [Butyricimonas faecalis]
MMKKLQFMICILGLLGLNACSDYLNKESSDEVIVKTVSDYSELLLGAGYPEPTGSLYNTLYLLDDDYMLNENSLDDEEDYSGAVSAFPFYTWQANMWERQEVNASTYGESYSPTYTRLMGVNAVLDGIDEAIGEIEDRDQVKAEALALRGYYYFMLVNLYGEPYNYNKQALGVPLKLTANMETNGTARSTVEDVYKQIVSDLKAASDLFEKYPKRRGSYRINLPATNILLSRVYLHMELWDEAIAAATKAIENGGVLTNYVNLKSSSTCISNYNYSEVEWVYGNGNTPTRSLPGMVVSTELRNKFLENPNDTRINLWFLINRTNWNITKKRISYPSGTPRTPTNSIRMSEAYLNRSEAYAQKGECVAAWNDLSHLRENRYKEYSETAITDATVLLKEIREERRLELCFDEVRWFDLRRYGMPSISHLYKVRKSASWQTYTLNEKDPLYTLPLPSDVMNENSALQQNESAKEPLRQGR